MISGLSTSGIATAIRTAGQARATMDTMSRQIATGQRVSSARDDGAAWLTASLSRSDALASRQLGSDLRRLGDAHHIAIMSGEARLEVVASMKGRAVFATDPGLSASTRAALDAAQKSDDASQTEFGWNRIGTAFSIRNTSGTNWGPFSEQAERDDLTWVSSIDGGTSSSTGGGGFVSGGAIDDLTTAAAATIAAAEADRWRDFIASRIQIHGALGTRLLKEGDAFAARADRLDRMASSLTDADLGKASAARATAETRQQLALSTVRQAISAYGNFAGGLLGNVQRTQRGIMA